MKASLDLKALLMHATNSARQAGAILKQASSEYLKINFQSEKDVKLQADVASEQIIRTYLSEQSQLPIIGEEEGGDASLLDSITPYWVIDPLDGTYNYLREQPFSCVSIGLMLGMEPLLGVIYDFNREILYTGIVGEGIWLNDSPVYPKWAQSTKTACLVTGFPSGRSYSTESLDIFIQRVQAYQKIRMIGSAALALTYVAYGNADIYYEESIRLWDVAAGIALVKAAGGVYTLDRLDSGPFLAVTICAASQMQFLI